MGDDSNRRDAWRQAQLATTVTGRRVQPGAARREGIHEEYVPDPTHETARVTHPSNAAPEEIARRAAWEARNAD
jgi:hypothetical protein